MTDRHNLVQVADLGMSVPLPASAHTLFVAPSGAVQAQIVAYATLLSELNPILTNLAADTHSLDSRTAMRVPSIPTTSATAPVRFARAVHRLRLTRSMPVLNAAPAYFDGGLWPLSNAGYFAFMSSRNNEFGTVSQKGMVVVAQDWQLALAIAGGTIGGLLLLTFIILVSIRGHAEAHPDGRLSRTALAVRPSEDCCSLQLTTWNSAHWCDLDDQRMRSSTTSLSLCRKASPRFRRAMMFPTYGSLFVCPSVG
jgi:hypothetical protein